MGDLQDIAALATHETARCRPAVGDGAVDVADRRGDGGGEAEAGGGEDSFHGHLDWECAW